MELKQTGVHVIVVAIGTFINFVELENIASPPINQTVIRVNRYELLSQIMLNRTMVALIDGKCLQIDN